jgi:hypothetical protein
MDACLSGAGDRPLNFTLGDLSCGGAEQGHSTTGRRDAKH